MVSVLTYVVHFGPTNNGCFRYPFERQGVCMASLAGLYGFQAMV
jgi:hypothetical protein